MPVWTAGYRGNLAASSTAGGKRKTFAQATATKVCPWMTRPTILRAVPHWGCFARWLVRRRPAKCGSGARKEPLACSVAIVPAGGFSLFHFLIFGVFRAFAGESDGNFSQARE